MSLHFVGKYHYHQSLVDQEYRLGSTPVYIDYTKGAYVGMFNIGVNKSICKKVIKSAMIRIEDNIRVLTNDSRFIVIDGQSGLYFIGAYHNCGSDISIDILAVYDNMPANNGTPVFII